MTLSGGASLVRHSRAHSAEATMTTEGPARGAPRHGSAAAEVRRRARQAAPPRRQRPVLRLTGRFARYLEDPYTPRTEREPKTDHRTVVFIGGGFAGLVAARG